MTERHLCFRKIATGEFARCVNVTGSSELTIERTLRGMLINMNPDWYVDDITGPLPEGAQHD